jgi:type II secretory pathway pseudopilin PulG
LVELVIVVIVIGILAAMALPEFGSLGTEAANTNAESVAAGLGAAAITRNAQCAVGLSAGDCSLDCSSALALLSGITVADYTVTGTPAVGCTVRHVNGTLDYVSAAF